MGGQDGHASTPHPMSSRMYRSVLLIPPPNAVDRRRNFHLRWRMPEAFCGPLRRREMNARTLIGWNSGILHLPARKSTQHITQN